MNFAMAAKTIPGGDPPTAPRGTNQPPVLQARGLTKVDPVAEVDGWALRGVDY